MKIYVNQSQYGWQTQARNGEDRMYIDVQFKKGQEPDSSFCRIDIKDAFFSMYKTKTGLAKPKLVIMEYEKISKEEYVQNDEENNPYEINDPSDLPF